MVRLCITCYKNKKEESEHLVNDQKRFFDVEYGKWVSRLAETWPYLRLVRHFPMDALHCPKTISTTVGYELKEQINT